MISNVLGPYRRQLDEALEEYLQAMKGPEGLVQACRYALLSGGKRFRPAIVYMVAGALGLQRDVSAAALAIEFFHTASLVADDLPCMDNDDVRRDRPTVHKAFDESTALLVTYSLISAGYHCLGKAAHKLAGGDLQLVLACLENATINTGVQGAAGGQYLDLSLKEGSLDALKEMLFKKTGTLFEIAFVFGWLFGGGKQERLEDVKKLAYHWGMAFQIADDLGDLGEEGERFGNIAAFAGSDSAFILFQEHLASVKALLDSLALTSEAFCTIIDALYSMACTASSARL